MSSVAFLGLGVMGAPMARHLAAAGHSVTVYNRTPDKALAWVALYGHRAAPTPREAAEGAEFVLMCVGNDNDVRDVVYGPDGALGGCGRRRRAGRPHHGLGQGGQGTGRGLR
ncbi:MAG: NAD(P)-binding domain-containing protein [Ilumatobacteraceae bacterium]